MRISAKGVGHIDKKNYFFIKLISSLFHSVNGLIHIGVILSNITIKIR